MYIMYITLPICRIQQKVQTFKKPFASIWSFFEWVISCPLEEPLAAAGSLPGLVCQNRRRRAALGFETQGLVEIIITSELAQGPADKESYLK